MRARSRKLPCSPLLLLSATLWTAGVSCSPDSPKQATEPPQSELTTTAQTSGDELQRLRALGYVAVGEPLAPGAAVGVVHFDRERAQPGLNLFTNAMFCSTQLMDMEGEVLHQWSHPDCFRWAQSILLEGGDLLVIGRWPDGRTDEGASRDARYLMRMSWTGKVRWIKRVPVHHDLEITPDGRILSLTYERRLIPDVHESIPVRDHSIALFTRDGELIEEVSLWNLLKAGLKPVPLASIEPREAEFSVEVDLIHANSAEWIRSSEEFAIHPPAFGPNHILVCLRNQDLVVVIDWEKKEPVWSWGRGELVGPHDARFLPNGHILIFDTGLGRGWSRVLEVDPVTGEIVWQYRADETSSFYTRTGGANQRLANGNTLISESDSGRVFEVTTDGDLVWEFRNFNLTERREPSVVTRMHRLEGLDFDRAAERLAAERAHARD